ncbi:ATP-binding protein [Actinomadura sp. GC306]|uniref:ATP-binding protein n=1 Tax=Actinomadura sp. GC306 TaxID=2530367 RepID=UPI00140505C2|nr:ATP-binding protein [Actinomadura sp. GC306]
MTETATARGIPWRLENGGCAALPLPGDPTIAAVARGHVTALLPALGLPAETIDDVALMVSELATNILDHATPGGGAPSAELWVYQRGDGSGHDELVVKAFDTVRHWRGHPGGPGRMRERGRGLEIIDILTDGRWGHHPSRSRLSTPAARGKATWFALPIPRTRTARGRRHGRTPTNAAQAAKALHTMLVRRGIDGFALGHEPGVSMLTCDDLSVRCDDETFRWHARTGEAGELPVTDITEVGEQIVRLREAMNDVHVV